MIDSKFRLLGLVLCLSLFCGLGCQTTEKKSAKSATANSSTAASPSGSTARPDSEASPRATPKFGFILGPGGLKTFAELGVLRELESAKVPIDYIVGLEWGALVGATYSMKGKANDADWKMLKLKKDHLPSGGLFKSGQEAADIGVAQPFLKDVFEESTVESAQIPFSCPSTSLAGDRTIWSRHGSFKEAVEMCLVYPPIYKSTREFVAAPFEVRAAAKRLRDMGADVVVLINVLAQGTVWRSKNIESQLLWREIKTNIAEQTDGVDFVIGVHTREYDIVNFEARRSLMLFGAQAGTVAAKKLTEKYGL